MVEVINSDNHSHDTARSGRLNGVADTFTVALRGNVSEETSFFLPINREGTASSSGHHCSTEAPIRGANINKDMGKND